MFLSYRGPGTARRWFDLDFRTIPECPLTTPSGHWIGQVVLAKLKQLPRSAAPRSRQTLWQSIGSLLQGHRNAPVISFNAGYRLVRGLALGKQKNGRGDRTNPMTVRAAFGRGGDRRAVDDQAAVFVQLLTLVPRGLRV
jgi:hypothetical protein